MNRLEEFLSWHSTTFGAMLKKRAEMRREPFWSSAIAVGDKSWLAELSVKEGLTGAKLPISEALDGKTSFLMGKR
jgi:hypothetical protein